MFLIDDIARGISLPSQVVSDPFVVCGGAAKLYSGHLTSLAGQKFHLTHLA